MLGAKLSQNDQENHWENYRMNSFSTKCQFLIHWSNKLLKRSQSSSRNAAYNANVGPCTKSNVHYNNLFLCFENSNFYYRQKNLHIL